MKKFLRLSFVSIVAIALLVQVASCNKSENAGAKNGGQSVVKKGLPLKFDSIDLQTGEQITQTILANADVTLVNVWATWCGPCAKEMPDLGNIHREYASKGGQVLGITSDGLEEPELSKQMLTELGCDYPSVAYNESLEAFLDDIVAFPTTIFVDKAGNIIGEPIVSTRTYEEFVAAFDKALGEVH